MRLVKVFDTSTMPESFFEDGHNLFDFIDMIKDEHTRHTVGAFVKEASGKVGYSQKDVTFCAELDAWLIENGATEGEEILIYHG